MSAAIGRIGAGHQARTDDRDLLDAAFLRAHPGWTWDDLQRTPERVLRIMTKLDAAQPRSS